jgi:DNA-directed RNA polymerase specialized sigma24 family protein
MQDEQHTLITRARAGEPVRDEMVLSPALQRTIKAQARRYMRRVPGHMNGVLEQADLIQSANEAMLQRYPAALTKKNPYTYLQNIARLAMLDCINGRSDSIKTRPSRKQQRVLVLSLDLPIVVQGVLTFPADLLSIEVCLPSPQEERTLEALISQIIQGLPEKQRMVIERHYGINEHAPESLNAISRSLALQACTRYPAHANYHHKRALSTLRQALAGGVQ